MRGAMVALAVTALAIVGMMTLANDLHDRMSRLTRFAEVEIAMSGDES